MQKTFAYNFDLNNFHYINAGTPEQDNPASPTANLSLNHNFLLNKPGFYLRYIFSGGLTPPGTAKISGLH